MSKTDVMLEKLAHRIAELEVALRPFALLAIDNPETPDGVPIRYWSNTVPITPAVEPTMADCRRAAALLASTAPQPSPEPPA